jgi:hypothetical protein
MQLDFGHSAEQCFQKIQRSRDPEIQKLQKIVDALRLFDGEVPAQAISIFFYVAPHNDCTQTQPVKAIVYNSSSASRCADWLSCCHRFGKPGMALMVEMRNCLDRGDLNLYLTPKSIQVIEQNRGILNG